MIKLNFKNIATVALTTILSFSSCEKESDWDTDEDVILLDRIYAVMNDDSQDGLKSYQQGCYGIHEIHNKWNDGDIAHLLSFVKGNGGLNYWGHADYVRDGYTGNYATFVPVSTAVEYKTNGNGNGNGNSNSYSYIAAAHNATWPENPNKGKFNIQANFEVKSSQTFNDSIVNSMPMIALSGPFGKNGGDNFQDPKLVPFHFQNLASIIRFDVTPDHNDHDKHITKITVTGNNICGSGNVIYEETKLDLKYNWTGGGNTISLSCGGAHEINGVKSYTMIVPPLTNVPLTIVITASNGKTKTLKGNATIARSAFKKVAVDLSDPDFQ